MASKSKKSVHSEPRNIIKAVVEFFDKEKASVDIPLDKATELAAAATVKSISFIKKIRNEAATAENSVLKSPSKKKRSGGSNKWL